MLFKSLGELAAHKAVLILMCWAGLLAVCIWAAPDLRKVAQNGEFAFLPEDAASRVAEAKFKEAFPDDLDQSNIVLVVRREQGEGLSHEDYEFLSKWVIPELHRIAGLPTAEESNEVAEDLVVAEAAAKERPAQGINSFEDKRIGELYISDNKKATSIVVSLRPDATGPVKLDSSNGSIKLSVTDNGIGISPENRTRIFGHGFTTKTDGHGFGLHSGALAAKEMGASDARIIFRHLYPNVLSHVIVILTLTVPSIILAESFLSFLGIGITEPLISWGLMMRNTQDIQTLGQNSWILAPIAFMVIAVLGFNFLGDGLRDARDVGGVQPETDDVWHD